MNKINFSEINKDNVLFQICDFLNIEQPNLEITSLKETIKQLCVARLCKAIGLTGKYNYKSEFFEFFSCVMGEAICEKLSIKMHIACDELRLIKYEHINLVNQIKSYLDSESVEEAFLDAFELLDKFKYLIPKLKKA